MKCVSIVFLALISLSCCEKKISIDEVKGKKFDFALFENVDGTRDAYLQEAEIVMKLKQIRQQLKKVKEVIKQQNWSHINDLKNLKSQIQTVKNGLEDSTSEYPRKEDYEGAKKGLISIYEVTEFNVTEAILTGNFVYVNHEMQIRQFSSHEKLSISDVESLIDVAMQRQTYSIGVYLMHDLMPLIPGIKQKKLKKRMESKRKNLVKLNNGYLQKTQKMISKFINLIMCASLVTCNFSAPLSRTLPYLVGNDMKQKNRQPEFVQNGDIYKFNVGDDAGFEWLFFYICKMGRFSPPVLNLEHKCRFLHHQDPYLKLGPFKEEQISLIPYVVVFHDILSDLEIDYLIEESRPNLSRTRIYNDNSGRTGNNKKGVRIVSKTVQAWLTEAQYPQFNVSNPNWYVGKNYEKIIHPVLWKLSKKIQLATQLRTDSQLSGTSMQVTNYGLSGLCETHMDPHGLMELKGELPESRQTLWKTGDMLGTFMAWLSNTAEGGGTVYMQPGFEGIITPERGSAGFWYDLDSSLYKDMYTRHGGCPVIKGSKWILNKWIYAYDNFAKFPCKLEHRAFFDPPSASHYL